MASGHTENYNLCQWEGTDKVERLDFNADNASIEAALTAHDTQIAAVRSEAAAQLTQAKTDLTGEIETVESALDAKITAAKTEASNSVTTLRSDMDTQVSALNTKITTANTNIATNKTNIATNTTNIATNKKNISTNTTNIASANTKITNLQTSVADCFSSSNLPYVVGYYTGNGAETRVISLGFTPKAVLVFRSFGWVSSSGNYAAGLAITGRNVSTTAEGRTSWVTGATVIAIVNGGFQVSADGNMITSNYNGEMMYYIAFK